jgi:hypothetical protein
MNSDGIKIEILEDGTVSVTTDQVSGTNHVSADKLLRDLAAMLGGEVKVTKRTKLGVNVHIHENGVPHTH